MRNVAKAWVGYLEHATNDLLGVFTANIGKGGYTIFSVIIQRYYRWRNFSGLAWCATFVHAVCLEAYGVDKARKLVGKPHPGTRVLARRLKRQGRLKGREYTPQPNDLVGSLTMSKATSSFPSRAIPTIQQGVLSMVTEELWQSAAVKQTIEP